MLSTWLRGALGGAALSRRPQTESADQPHDLFSEPRVDAVIQDQSVSTAACCCGLGLGNITRIILLCSFGLQPFTNKRSIRLFILIVFVVGGVYIYIRCQPTQWSCMSHIHWRAPDISAHFVSEEKLMQWNRWYPLIKFIGFNLVIVQKAIAVNCTDLTVCLSLLSLFIEPSKCHSYHLDITFCI